MGILDDAIREHLELRRRNGADADELRRLEQSLLSDAPAEEPEAEADQHPPVEPAPEHAAEPEPEHAAEPEPPAPAAARELTPVEQPTRQFTAAELEAAEAPLPSEQAPAEDAQAGEHDELEETPDFLQETPEHDRLWFEQKPPKDFDF